MSQNVCTTPSDDGLPDPMVKIVEGVSKAGEVAGKAAGGVAGVPLALAAKGIAAMCGKSSSESDAIAERVFQGSLKVGQVAGKVAPLAVLTAPFVLAWKLSRRK